MADNNNQLFKGLYGRGKRVLETSTPSALPPLRQPRERPGESSSESCSSSSVASPPPSLSPTGGAIRKLPPMGRSRLNSGTSGYDSYTPTTTTTSSLEGSSSSAPKPSYGRAYHLGKYFKEVEGAISTTSSSHSSLGRGRGTAAALKDLMQRKSSSSGSTCDQSSLSRDFEQLRIPKEEEEEDIKKYHGDQGARIKASSNWIRIALDPEKQVFEYAVGFKPSVDDKRARFRLLNTIYQEIGNVKVFDGASKLWLPRKLPQMVTKFSSPHPLTSEDVEISLSLKHQSAMWHCVQLYNVLFNRIMGVLKMTMMGKGYFSEDLASIVKSQNLEIWPGYVTGAHQMEGGVMLCVDISHRVLRQNTVYDCMREIYDTHQGRQDVKQAIISELVGSVVLTRYNKKTYRIDDIAHDMTPQSTFEMHSGKQISYFNYYKDTYNKVIRDLNQPLLMHKLKKRELKDKDKAVFIYLVPELCFLTGLTDNMRADYRVMKDIAQHTRLTPNARQASLRKFIHNVRDTPEAQKLLSDWGLSLLADTIELEGRIVPKEVIYLGNNKELRDVQDADWGRESCREAVLVPADLKASSWMIVVPRRIERCARSFLSMMQQVTRGLGMRVGAPEVVVIQDDRIETYIKAITDHYTQGLTQLAVVIFPTPREDRYSAVKRLVVSELGLNSQCINARTISQDNKLRSVTAKIALQINCKLGGELWAIKVPVDGIMVCGIDVYHDPVRKGASVVGFVGSVNPKVTRWYTHVSFQNPGEETVNGMKISFLECLKAYYKENHSIPKTVVIYRDGVSEGLLKLTEGHEVPQIATVLVNFAAGQQTKLYYIIVLKRISTRIFVSLNASAYDNPPPGTIVDHTITKRNWYDFFLVSQHVRQGTVSPTHYIVLKESSGLSPNHIQRLTYKMTHLYYNWPGTIRVPAPCLYAHKVAYLVGQNVRKDPHPDLRDKLYFL